MDQSLIPMMIAAHTLQALERTLTGALDIDAQERERQREIWIAHVHVVSRLPIEDTLGLVKVMSVVATLRKLRRAQKEVILVKFLIRILVVKEI